MDTKVTHFFSITNSILHSIFDFKKKFIRSPLPFTFSRRIIQLLFQCRKEVVHSAVHSTSCYLILISFRSRYFVVLLLSVSLTYFCNGMMITIYYFLFTGSFSLKKNFKTLWLRALASAFQNNSFIYVKTWSPVS